MIGTWYILNKRILSAKYRRVKEIATTGIKMGMTPLNARLTKSVDIR